MRSLAFRACTFGGLLASLALVASADEPIEYNRDIRPILAENCFACHGPDSAARKADLRLDKRDAAIQMGALLPNDAEGSTVYDRICSEDPKQVMPPPATNKVLTAEQKDLLKRWIDQGAEYQAHWSFLAPTRPAVPAVKTTGWARNPIDNFVLAQLEARGLQPAPEADRRTLARRLSLDLTGLPPEPADVEAFVNDTNSDYYEKFVDRLMESKHWGEHRARYWLDAARYADTHGIHFDNYREIWAYRDWVIGAFNRNLPFDQFTIEQLAGDLLPNRTLEQQVASGFNRCNMTTNEGGTIPEEYLVLYTRDRTETTSQVWLGLTAGCAVCHDHKFDPLSQKEFYELAAFFNNTTQPAMDGNVKDTAPIVTVPRVEDRERWDTVNAEVPQARQQLEARRQAARPEFDQWLAAATPATIGPMVPEEGLRLHARLSEGVGNALVSSDAGDFERDQQFSYGAWVQIPQNAPAGSVFGRMDEDNFYRGWDLWYENGRIGTHIIHKWQEDALKVVAREPLKAGQWNHIFVTYDGTSKVEGIKVYLNGVLQAVDVQAGSLNNSIRTTVPFKVGQRNKSSKIEGLGVRDVSLFGRSLAADEVHRLSLFSRAAWLLGKPAPQRTPEEVNDLYQTWLPTFDKPFQELNARVTALEAERNQIQSRGTIAHVMNEKTEPAMAFILFRGEYDKRRDEVKPAIPASLPRMRDELPRNRLGFAQWLLEPENPLTTRVTVNRFWQEVFGTGLVKTSGDFGISGELPSHPELLDWMAVEFRESGWDVRKFFKLMVTSGTYRQSAQATPEKLEKDPANKLLSRGPRFRMDGEMVRDYALAASGLLVPKIGGPSVRPYQPPGVWEAVAMIGSNTRDYVADKGEGLYRRSMYTFWKRAAPPALMDIFNAPNRETCSVRRERTNTPLQALATLNDPTFVESARHLAQRALLEGGETNETKLAFLASRILSRPLRSEELPVIHKALAELTAFYQEHEADARELISYGDSKANPSLDPKTLAAWTMLTNELLNLDEVLNK